MKDTNRKPRSALRGAGKLSLTAFAALALAGCGGPPPPQPPGHYLEANREEDFALTCDDIWVQSEKIKKQISYYRRIPSATRDNQQRDVLRDNNARLRVLHRWGKKKNCQEQWGQGGFDPDQAAPAQQQPAATQQQPAQAPAAKEKSRVIICADDQTCVVE